MGWHIQNRWSFHELSFESHQQSSLSPAKPPSLTFWKGTALPKKSKHLIYLAANAKSRCHRRPGDLAVRSAAVTRWAAWAPGFRKRQQRLGRTLLLDGTQVVSLNKAHPGHKATRVQGAHSTERTAASPSDNHLPQPSISDTEGQIGISRIHLQLHNFSLHLNRCHKSWAASRTSREGGSREEQQPIKAICRNT